MRPYLFLSIMLLLLASSCQMEDDGTTSSCIGDFNQTTLFENISTNLIIPSYQELDVKMSELYTAVENLNTNPTPSTLAEAQDAWLVANLSWKKVEQYNFGPAQDVLLRSQLNSFPLNVNLLTTRLEEENYTFGEIPNFDRGFPAMEYLLFGIAESNDAIVLKYTESGTNYANLLLALVTHASVLVKTTSEGWTNGYQNTFLGNTGTAAGTSLSLLINGLNENFEILKRDKVGIPSGVLTLGFTNPDKLEAPYSKQSQALGVASLQATIDLFEGKEGVGLDDLLDHVDAKKEETALAFLIRQQFYSALSIFSNLNEPLVSLLADEENTIVTDLYNELTKQVVNIKTDMPSVLCVAITYIDNPSDSD